MDSYCKNKLSISDLIKIISAILVAITAITFFIYQMQGLPPRVDKLEKDLPAMRQELTNEINGIKTQLSKNDVKTDIILDDVKIIRSYILNKEKGK